MSCLIIWWDVAATRRRAADPSVRTREDRWHDEGDFLRGCAVCRHDRASDGIRHVIVRARRMIDTVSTASSSAALEAAQLRDKAGVVEQFAPTAV